jgi:uncharacterized protein YcbK (DUF882 family)|tara:strand:- start:232 stop:612 length:381 start_codon:yes stop_codon:yes gene_type:complete
VLYDHYEEAEYDWIWSPYFKPKEIACKGTDSLLINPEALNVLVRARILADKPFRVTSGFRSRTHNAFVGGSPKSSHKDGIAFDISLQGHDKEDLLAQCQAAGFGSFGKYKTFLHVDTRKGRRWGNW